LTFDWSKFEYFSHLENSVVLNHIRDVSLCWLHSVWQNHYYVMLLFYQGCCLFQSLHFRKVVQNVQRIFCADSKFPSGLPSHAFGRPSVSRRFEQFKVKSVWMSWQHVRTLIEVQQVIRFPSQTRIWEDNCIRPNVRATPSWRGPLQGKTWRRITTVRMSGQHRQDVVLILVITCSKICNYSDCRATSSGCS